MEIRMVILRVGWVMILIEILVFAYFCAILASDPAGWAPSGTHANIGFINIGIEKCKNRVSYFILYKLKYLLYPQLRWSRMMIIRDTACLMAGLVFLVTRSSDFVVRSLLWGWRDLLMRVFVRNASKNFVNLFASKPLPTELGQPEDRVRHEL